MQGLTKIVKNNLFIHKVVDWFSQNEWLVEINPLYKDNQSKVTKRVDLVVEKEYFLKHDYIQEGIETKIVLRFFIECINFENNKIAFSFGPKDHEKALDLIALHTIIDEPEVDRTVYKHRYFYTNEVGKLYQGLDVDVINNAISGTLDSLLHYKDHPFVIPLDHPLQSPSTIYMDYAVILFDSFDGLYSCGSESEEKIKDNFIIEVNYSDKERNRCSSNYNYFVEAVSFKNIDNLIKDIEGNDLRAIKSHIVLRPDKEYIAPFNIFESEVVF